MIHYADAGTLVYFLYVTPLMPSPDSSVFNSRWFVRMVLILRLIYHLSAYLVSNRASPRSSLFCVSMWTGLIILLCAAAFVEFQRKYMKLEEYHDQLGRAFVLCLGLAFLARQILKSCVFIPGPFLATHTFLWVIWHLLRGTSDQAISAAHQEYGPIIRVSPYEHSISDFRLAGRFPSARSIDVQIFTGTCIEILLSYLEQLPYLLRDDLMMSKAISHESVVDSCTDVLLARLAEYADRGEPVQLSRLITCYVWDVMSATTVGDRFGFLNSESASTVAEKLQGFKAKGILRGSFFRFYPWITKIFKRMTFQESVAMSTSYLFDKIIEERLSRESDQQEADHEIAAEKLMTSCMEKSEFLQDFLNPGEPVKKVSPMRRLHIVLALLLTTADPTAVHLLTTFLYLGIHPEARDRIRQEARWFKDDPSLEDLAQLERDLPFLDAVLHESARLMSSSGCIFTRSSMDGPATINGHRIPPVCTIRLSAFAAGRDKSIFGDDANIWRPERWLGGEKPTNLAFGQTTFSDSNSIAKAIVSKTVLRVIKMFDFEAKMSPINSTVVFLSSKELNDIVLLLHKGNFDKQAPLTTTPVSSLTLVTEDSDDVKFFCSKFAKEDQSIILGLLNSKDANKELENFTSLKTIPITDRRQRTKVHQLNRAFFKGQLDSNFERAKSTITLFKKGSSNGKYHNGPIKPTPSNHRKSGLNKSHIHPFSYHGASSYSTVKTSQRQLNAGANTFEPTTQTLAATQRTVNPIWDNFVGKEKERKTSSVTTDATTAAQPEPEPIKWKETFKLIDRKNGERMIECSSRRVNNDGDESQAGQAAIVSTGVKNIQQPELAIGKLDAAQPSAVTEFTGPVMITEPVLKWKETYKITKPIKGGDWAKSSSRELKNTEVTSKTNDGCKIETGPTFKSTFIFRRESSESMKSVKSDQGGKKAKSVGPHRTAAAVLPPHKRFADTDTKL